MRNSRINWIATVMISILFVRGAIWHVRYSEERQELLIAIPTAEFVWCRCTGSSLRVIVRTEGKQNFLYEFPYDYIEPKILDTMERSGMAVVDFHGDWSKWVKSGLPADRSSNVSASSVPNPIIR